MIKIKYFSTSTLTRKKRPIIKLPGKIVERAVGTGLQVTNREIVNADFKYRLIEKRVNYSRKSLKLVVPTLASEHWVSLIAKWRCVLEHFTDPNSGDEQFYWLIDGLDISSYSIECPAMYDLSATIQMVGAVKTMKGPKGNFPKVKFKIEFESIGPTGAKTKTSQLLQFDFIKGNFKKA